jgi:rRNA processing protein Krr1/Pno1
VPVVQDPITTKTKSKKKKSKKSKNTTVSDADNGIEDKIELKPIKDVASDIKNVEVIVPPVVVEVVKTEVVEIVLEEENTKKSKKSKETAEQKLARLERQKNTKANKLKQEDIIEPVQSDLENIDNVYGDYSSIGVNRSANADGWAVVGNLKKLNKKAANVPVVNDKLDNFSEVADVIVVPKQIEEVVVDVKKVPMIIGSKGATINRIRELTGVEIELPKEREATGTCIVTITGPEEGLKLATKAVKDLSIKGYSSVLSDTGDFKEGSILVHSMYLSEIIGKNGSCIRAIQDNTNTKFYVPPDMPKEEKPTHKRINIAGPKDKVAIAKDLVKELMTFYHTSVTHPGFVHEEMNVDPTLYNHIIGARGSEIKHIQNNFKVSVYIPNSDSVTQNVLIVGTREGCDNAVRYIQQKIIDQANRDVEATKEKALSWNNSTDDLTETHESWMDEYTHPSQRKNPISDNLSSSTSSISVNNSGAWASAVLTSSEGW